MKIKCRCTTRKVPERNLSERDALSGFPKEKGSMYKNYNQIETQYTKL